MGLIKHYRVTTVDGRTFDEYVTSPAAAERRVHERTFHRVEIAEILEIH